MSTGRVRVAESRGPCRRRAGKRRERTARCSRPALDLPSEPVWLEQVHGVTVLDLDGDAARARRRRRHVARRRRLCGAHGRLPAGAPLRPRRPARRRRARGLARAAARRVAGGRSSARRAARRRPRVARARDRRGGLRGRRRRPRRVPRARSGAAERFFAPNARGRWQADLYGLARRELARRPASRPSRAAGFARPRRMPRFFSHRREAPCGRMAALVWLAGSTARELRAARSVA